MKFLDGIRHLAPDYDGFVLDLWGVVHNGVAPLPGAPECLEALARADKRVVLLSNAPRRAETVGRQLERMGIPSAHYTGIMTSGEACHWALRDRPDEWTRNLGERMFYIGPDRDLGLTSGLSLTRVLDPADATFILNTGPDHLAPPEEAGAYDHLLRQCALHRLPMLCANPDLEVIVGGQRVFCAGTLAVRYMELGGTARLLGKPDPAIYVPVLALLGCARERVLAVGDALRTDIAGATAAGLASCWVMGGLHAEHLGGDEATIRAEAASAGLSPVATIPTFVW